MLFKKLLIFTTLMMLFAACEEAPRQRFFDASLQNAGNFVDPDADKEVEFTPPTRPDGEVFLQPGGCGCENGEPITLGQCTNFCVGKGTNAATFYMYVKISEAIETNPNFGNLAGWCANKLTWNDPETGEVVTQPESPNCEIVAKDQDGGFAVPGTPLVTSTTGSGGVLVTFNIATFQKDKTYKIQLKEAISGAASDYIQLRIPEESILNPIAGPLRIQPTFGYSCVNRQVFQDGDSGQTIYGDAFLQHFYFVSEDRPEPLPIVSQQTYCHDIYQFGNTPINNPLLNETPGAFSVWDKNDPRFFDLDDNAEMQINDLIAQEIRNQGQNLTTVPKLFFPLEYPNGPEIEGESTGSGRKSMGYYMVPWIDQSNFRAFCPTQTHYYGVDPTFRAMRELIGADTEGLYIAKQNGKCDFILVKESLIKQIWFYQENGAHVQPTDSTIQGKQIQFYWPADTNSPYIKKSDQKVYTVKPANNLGCEADSSVSNNSSQISTSYPPHDNRIGCVPAL